MSTTDYKLYSIEVTELSLQERISLEARAPHMNAITTIKVRFKGPESWEKVNQVTVLYTEYQERLKQLMLRKNLPIMLTGYIAGEVVLAALIHNPEHGNVILTEDNWGMLEYDTVSIGELNQYKEGKR